MNEFETWNNWRDQMRSGVLLRSRRRRLAVTCEPRRYIGMARTGASPAPLGDLALLTLRCVWGRCRVLRLTCTCIALYWWQCNYGLVYCALSFEKAISSFLFVWLMSNRSSPTEPHFKLNAIIFSWCQLNSDCCSKYCFLLFLLFLETNVCCPYFCNVFHVCSILWICVLCSDSIL